MMRFVHAAALLALGAALGGCSDHAAELESARRSQGQAAGVPTAPTGAQLPGLPTTPTVGTAPLPGTPLPTTGGACQPKQIAAISPAWRPPSQPRAACTQQEGAAIVDCAFANTSCNVASAGCRGCAVSPKSTSSFYGPLIVDEATGGLELNVEGCAALLQGDISANGCGPRLQARYMCEEQACAHCGSPQEVQACIQAAGTGVCAQYVTTANQCLNFATQCLAGGSEARIAFDLIGMFCGG